MIERSFFFFFFPNTVLAHTNGQASELVDALFKIALQPLSCESLRVLMDTFITVQVSVIGRLVSFSWVKWFRIDGTYRWDYHAIFLHLRKGHVHTEAEKTPMTYTFRLDIYAAFWVLYNLFDDR